MNLRTGDGKKQVRRIESSHTTDILIIWTYYLRSGWADLVHQPGVVFFLWVLVGADVLADLCQTRLVEFFFFFVLKRSSMRRVDFAIIFLVCYILVSWMAV